LTGFTNLRGDESILWEVFGRLANETRFNAFRGEPNGPRTIKCGVLSDPEFATSIAQTATSHQFPLGGTLSLSRRIALLDWASENKMWIFEDDYNSEFGYTAQPIQALQGLDKQQRVIYAGSFSKMMFPGFHLGFLVIPENLVGSFKIAKYYADTRTAYLEQTNKSPVLSAKPPKIAPRRFGGHA